MASEEQRNTEIVKIVKKYPCLYDSSILDYVKKDICEKVWCNLSGKNHVFL